MFSCFLIEDWSKTGLSLGTTAVAGKSTYMLQCTVILKCCTQKNTMYLASNCSTQKNTTLKYLNTDLFNQSHDRSLGP